MSRKIDPDAPGFLIGDIAHLFRAAFEHEAARADCLAAVTPAEARVLAHMARLGAVRQTRLACAMGVSPMSLTSLLDRLEALGLVARGPDPTDRRAKIVSLAPRAEDVLPRVAEAGARSVALAQDGLDDTDKANFHRIAKVMRDNLRRARSAATAGGKDGQA